MQSTDARICTFPACGRPMKARGWCFGHYQQARKGKPVVPLQSDVTVADRLARHTDRSGECWIWTGHRDEGGYGRIIVGRSVRPAHRVAYELAHGPLPEDRTVDHICHTRACVRVEHLQAASPKQNAENRAGATVVSASGVRGVYRHASGKWMAKARHNGTLHHAGSFATIEEAEVAAVALRLRLFTNSLTDQR